MPVVTISRGTFSGGKELAECLGERLGMPCVSREVLAAAAAEHGVAVEELATALAKAPSFRDRMGWKRQRYLAYFRETLCRFAESGDMVYHGHGGHFLLRGVSHVLRVLVIADLESRTAGAMRREGLSHDEAEARVRHLDEERRKWTRFLYGAEWRNPFDFDLTVNLERLSVDEACEVVVRTADLPAFRPTAASRQALRDVALSAAAEAALLADRRTRLRRLVVAADEGAVTVQGVGSSPQDAEAVREVLESVEGAREVRVEIGFTTGIDES